MVWLIDRLSLSVTLTLVTDATIVETTCTGISTNVGSYEGPGE
jgi:hypothetical protein